MQRNPSLVQIAPPFRKAAVPLVLIHDGGGTTFSYHCLGSLERTVYAIHNPRFFSGRTWAGGITAMAKVYADLIRSVLPSGKLLLGGWSLGGLISLEIASILCMTPGLEVVGLIMIDSIFPGVLESQLANVVPHAPIFADRCKPEIRILVSNYMRMSSTMVDQWILPSWGPRAISPITGSERSAVRRCIDAQGECSSENGRDSAITSSRGDSTTSVDEESNSEECEMSTAWSSSESVLRLPSPPSTILLRCRSFVPVSKLENPRAVSRVDVARDCDLLGWRDYNHDLIQAVLDVPGHHFDLFSEKHIDITTARIKEACEMLEGSDL